MLTAPPSPTDPATLDRIRMSPAAWIAAGALVLVAVFFIIRLLELDLINEQTPNQDDPLGR